MSRVFRLALLLLLPLALPGCGAELVALAANPVHMIGNIAAAGGPELLFGGGPQQVSTSSNRTPRSCSQLALLIRQAEERERAGGAPENLVISPSEAHCPAVQRVLEENERRRGQQRR